jgi:regulator of protease activity HflC (stomatin/prohibitin superfamily)
MFDKLFELIVRFWDSFAFMVVIKDYEGGVVLRLGKYKRTLAPGLSMDLRPQTLTTRDGKAIVVSAIVKYRVRGVKEYLLEIWDSADVLKDVTMGSIREVINRTDYSDLGGNAEVETDVLEATRKAVNQYGFQIYKVTFVDLGLVRSIRLIGDTRSNPSDTAGG